MGIKYRNSNIRDRHEIRKVIMATKVDRGKSRLRKIKRRRRFTSSKESLMFK
jgi:hypothetical protein